MSDMATTCAQSAQKFVAEVLMLYFYGGTQLVRYMVSHLTRPTTRTWPPSGLKKVKHYRLQGFGTAVNSQIEFREVYQYHGS